MKKFGRRKSVRKKMPILANLFVLLAIPLGIYALIASDTFDTRNRAFEPELIKDRCIISFPYVNPLTIQQGSTVQVQVVAFVPGAAITNLNILGQAGTQVTSKSYDIPDEKISEVFRISPSSIGEYSLLGTITTDKGTTPCVLDGVRVANSVAINSAPEFLTQASSAKPSNSLKVNQPYEYTLRAEDTDGDNISYHFSFTPKADWLKYTAIEDGSDGKLTIKFTGVPDEPASYLANIFIHDGYNANLRAQTWTISVGQDQNDIPQVVVYSPAVDRRIERGDNVTVAWEVTDKNEIIKQELYIATDAGNPNSWKAIDTNLSGNVGSYVFDSSNTQAGRYQFVVRAFDNGTPQAIGTGASPVLAISVPVVQKPDEQDPDDGIILQDPQVVNISPANNAKVKDRNSIISATLIAGTNSKIDEESIKFVLDDEDKSGDIELNRISESEITLTYKASQIYSVGLHKAEVSFNDEKGGQAERSWVFNVVEEEIEEEDTYNILGFEITKRMAWILGGGIGILLLALIVPWLLYLAWRGEGDDYEQVYRKTTPIVPPASDADTFKTTRVIDKQEVPVQATIQAPKPVFDTAVSPPVEEVTVEVEKPEPIIEVETVVQEPVIIPEPTPIQEVKVEVEPEIVQEVVEQPTQPVVEPMPVPEPVVETPAPVVKEIPAVQDETQQTDELMQLAQELENIQKEEDGIEIQDTPPTPQVGA